MCLLFIVRGRVGHRCTNEQMLMRDKHNQIPLFVGLPPTQVANSGGTTIVVMVDVGCKHIAATYHALRNRILLPSRGLYLCPRRRPDRGTRVETRGTMSASYHRWRGSQHSDKATRQPPGVEGKRGRARVADIMAAAQLHRAGIDIMEP